jgi:hypothetical protein
MEDVTFLMMLGFNDGWDHRLGLGTDGWRRWHDGAGRRNG